jgi:predicted CXXCH cytochrome family protein
MMRTACCRALTAALALSASLVLLSCTPEEKHRVLTFFFDGVPPLHPIEVKAKPGATPATPAPQVTKVARPEPPRVVWYEHEPASDRKKCGECHDLKASFRLFKPVAELCITCHQETTREHPRMHGPVAVGDCAACHEAHRSPYRHVLRAPAPKLCLTCHESTPAGESTLGCKRASDEAACTTCHSAHGARDPFFLIERADLAPGPEAAPPPPSEEE